MPTVRIATRSSPLALWQAEHVSALLKNARPEVEVELVPMVASADLRLDVPIAELGGKGVFAKEVQQAVLERRADLAVHSAKDLPAVTGEGLCLAAVPERGEVRDALVGGTLAGLPQGARVATGSQRRRAQLAHNRPDLKFHELRGNMATRLSKAADFDAIVVAAVALQRLGLGDRLTEVLPVTTLVPQVGQGALAVECRADDEATKDLLSGIEDPVSRRRVDAERAFLAELGGDCDLPAGAHATVVDGALALVAVLAADARSTPARWEGAGGDPVELGTAAARALRRQVMG